MPDDICSRDSVLHKGENQVHIKRLSNTLMMGMSCLGDNSTFVPRFSTKIPVIFNGIHQFSTDSNNFSIELSIKLAIFNEINHFQ